MKNCLSIIMALITATVLIQPQVSAAETFADLDSTPWAETEITYLSEQGIIKGYGNGMFGPEDNVTRSQVALMLTKALYPEEIATTDPGFTDVPEDYFYYNAIAVAKEHGLVDGYPDGSFQPNAYITRAEASVMVDNAYGLERQGELPGFNDIEKLTWAKEEIRDLASHDILNGYPDGTFQPQDNINRAEFSVVLAKTINPELRETGELTASFIDVGQGDSTLLETSSGKTILVDGGRRSAGDEVVNYLAEAGITSIDLLVATHPDADHIGGLIDVLQQVEVKQVLDSGKTHTTDTYMEYLALIDEKNIPFATATEGGTWDYGNLDIKVLNALEDVSDNNESSIVLDVSYEETDFLLMGDATVETEADILQTYQLDADIIKVGHHGAATSTSEAFLEATKPEVGILSYGENNYGHPDSEVVGKLWSYGVELYATCGQGTITVTTDGYDYMVDAEPFTGSNQCTEVIDPEEQTDEFPVNVNTADAETLQLIPGVGPVISENIIEYRTANGPFESYIELVEVSGIGTVTLENMSPYITL